MSETYGTSFCEQQLCQSAWTKSFHKLFHFHARRRFSMVVLVILAALVSPANFHYKAPLLCSLLGSLSTESCFPFRPFTQLSLVFAEAFCPQLDCPPISTQWPAAMASKHVEPLEEPQSLAEKWESNKHIRKRLRENNGSLVKWPAPELTGKPTMAGISMNIHALRILAEHWCPQQKVPKSPSVNDLRKEAMVLKKMFIHEPTMNYILYMNHMFKLKRYTMQIDSSIYPYS